MNLLSKIVPWAKFIQPVLILLLMAALAWQTHEVKQRGLQLDREVTQRHEVAGIVGAQDNWESIRTHARAIVQSNTNLNGTLNQISRDTLAAKKRADALDEQLRREQAENDRRFAKAQRTIDDLLNQKSTGNDITDDQIIDGISKLPWTGWSQVEGWKNIANQNTWVGSTFYHPKVVVKLVPYANGAALRQAYLHASRKSEAQMKDFQVRGYSFSAADGTCEIHIVDPRIVFNDGGLGHELAHCFFGSWHKRVLP